MASLPTLALSSKLASIFSSIIVSPFSVIPHDDKIKGAAYNDDALYVYFLLTVHLYFIMTRNTLQAIDRVI